VVDKYSISFRGPPTTLVGTPLALFALLFGVLSFAYAARYYVAIAAVLLSPSANGNGTKNGANGGTAAVKTNGGLSAPPFVSVHIALYNEKNVVQRILEACGALAYPNFEVVVVDDSTDETTDILMKFIHDHRGGNPRFKLVHREGREGFKGGALNEALKSTDPRAQYVVVFDADFVPPPDTIVKLTEYFGKNGTNGHENGNGNNSHYTILSFNPNIAPSLEVFATLNDFLSKNGTNGHENGNGNGNNSRYNNGDLAAVQGYQWHTLNRTESWLTRAVSCEYSGNYMVDRTFQEIALTMKMIAGSVYAVRADLLREFGWSQSLTEDWELTLRLYTAGYKVLYTPLVQAPAECPSTLGSLFRQRMRWAEGHTFNVKKHFVSVMSSPKLKLREKLEFLYFAPYYLQSLFLIIGTAFWSVSDQLGTHLPFWTTLFGWALVSTNLVALPLMTVTGLLLERRATADFPGVFGQILLVYALAPYQAYASLKGLLEPREGSWARTYKSGRVSGFLGRIKLRKVMKKVLPPKKKAWLPAPGIVRGWRWPAAAAVIALLCFMLAHSPIASSTSLPPSYYFYDQPAPTGFNPLGTNQQGQALLMHLTPPAGDTKSLLLGGDNSSGPMFFSDAAPSKLGLPSGASVSAHLWMNATGESECEGETTEDDNSSISSSSSSSSGSPSSPSTSGQDDDHESRGCGVASTFNDTPVPTWDYLWFSSAISLQSAATDGLTILFSGQTVNLHLLSEKTLTLQVPDARVVFSSSSTSLCGGSASSCTTFSSGKWTTYVPPSNQGHLFLSGLSFQIPPGVSVGGASAVSWNGTVRGSAPFSLQWQWAAAAYTSLPATADSCMSSGDVMDCSTGVIDYNLLGVKPLDSTTGSAYANDDPSGTPENYKADVTGGGTGGGGSDWTGSLSAVGSASSSGQTVHVSIGIYDPQSNAIIPIRGADQVQTITVEPGISLYQVSWGSIETNQVILQGQTLVALLSTADSENPPSLLFNSASFPSSIGFPIEVPENVLAAAGLGAVGLFVATLLLSYGHSRGAPPKIVGERRGYRRIQGIVVASVAVIFLSLPFVATFNDLLSRLVISSGLAGAVASIVPYEASGISALLGALGLQAGNSADTVWLAGGFFPVTAVVAWNCSGWQSFVVLGLTSIVGLKEIRGRWRQLAVICLGVGWMYLMNVLRIALVVLLAHDAGYPVAIMFHDYAGTIIALAGLFGFWALVLGRLGKKDIGIGA